MKTVYKREIDRNYLILEQDEFQDYYQVGMLVRNCISGLLKCSLSRMDKTAAFYYEITSKQNLCFPTRRITILISSVLPGPDLLT